MDVKHDLVGKTITAIVAGTARQTAAREIWMLQFSDGTCVEFVSPGARKSLRRAATRTVSSAASTPMEAPQMVLNVA